MRGAPGPLSVQVPAPIEDKMKGNRQLLRYKVCITTILKYSSIKVKNQNSYHFMSGG
jgi:hypothetical protein